MSAKRRPRSDSDEKREEELRNEYRTSEEIRNELRTLMDEIAADSIVTQAVPGDDDLYIVEPPATGRNIRRRLDAVNLNNLLHPYEFTPEQDELAEMAPDMFLEKPSEFDFASSHGFIRDYFQVLRDFNPYKNEQLVWSTLFNEEMIRYTSERPIIRDHLGTAGTLRRIILHCSTDPDYSKHHFEGVPIENGHSMIYVFDYFFHKMYVVDSSHGKPGSGSFYSGYRALEQLRNRRGIESIRESNNKFLMLDTFSPTDVVFVPVKYQNWEDSYNACAVFAGWNALWITLNPRKYPQPPRIPKRNTYDFKKFMYISAVEGQIVIPKSLENSLNFDPEGSGLKRKRRYKKRVSKKLR